MWGFHTISPHVTVGTRLIVYDFKNRIGNVCPPEDSIQFRYKVSRTAILTDTRSLWLHSRRKHCETSNLHEKAKVSRMLSCISFFTFIPGSVRTAEFSGWMILYTKQAEGTPRSLWKSDRVHVVR